MNLGDDLDRELGLVDERKRTVLQVALLATIYFEHGHSMTKRQAIADCFADYRQMVRDKLCWAHPGGTGFETLKGAPSWDPAMKLVEPTFDENAGWEFFWHGGNTKEEANSFMISALGTKKWESEKLSGLSFLTFAFPIAWFAGRDKGLPSLLLGFAEKLVPVHGYAGVGLVRSPNRFLAQLHENTEYALAMRHMGLQMDYPIVHSLMLKSGIKGVDWLTILGDRWVKELGGVDVLAEKISPPASLHPYRGGVMLMSGPNPQLGDTNRALFPIDYASIAQVLRPIRIKTHSGVHGGGPFNNEAFAEWLSRLDNLASPNTPT